MQEVEKRNVKEGFIKGIHELQERTKQMLPTDRLYCNVATSVFAMALSLLSFGIISWGLLRTIVNGGDLPPREGVLVEGVAHAFYLLSASATIGLFWGLHKGLKQYVSSWLLFKMAEVWFISVAFVAFIFGHPDIATLLLVAALGGISSYFNWQVYIQYKQMPDDDEFPPAPLMDTPPHYDKIVHEI